MSPKTKKSARADTVESKPKPVRFGIVPLLLMLGLAIALAYSFFWMVSGTKPALQNAPESSPSCIEGQAKQCTAGNCTGTSLCMAGSWSGCTWKQVCVPGTAVPCVSEGCPQGVRRCNPCGSGYGPCG